MKTLLCKTALLTLPAFLIAVVLQCASPSSSRFAGGASTTEVSGIIFDGQGGPAAGAVVRLRPFDYVASDTGADSTVTIGDTLSDKDGCYRFRSVKHGRYWIECIYKDSLGLVLDCSVDSGKARLDLPDTAVKPMAVITGSVPLPKPDGQHPQSVLVMGMEHAAPVDSMGHFTLVVPEGWTRLLLDGPDQGATVIDTILFLQPGERMEFDHHDTPPPRPCDSLNCQLAAVRSILDSAGLTGLAPESVVVVRENRVEELRLRGHGVGKLPATIGKLEHLKVLDVGKNVLDSLPRSMDRLRNLEELIADSNALKQLPSSIGMLERLRRLNLSSNQLQSIPEPLTYLRSLDELDVDGNRLCTIGETTRRWLDRFDKGWTTRQDCR
jgi:hypothetical protein